MHILDPDRRPLARPAAAKAERFVDERGWFMVLGPGAAPAEETWAQENVSFSKRGVLRGLHFQHPDGQAKLLTVLQGEIFDVTVDIRRGSPEFGRVATCRMREDQASQLHIPAGFAHGFCVISHFALVHYRCSTPWRPEHEKVLLWSDPDLTIPWPLEDEPVLSAKDAAGRPLSALDREELPPLES
jgi:dTDP-4-dehydrorhamnose 3,5-epimerase